MTKKINIIMTVVVVVIGVCMLRWHNTQNSETRVAFESISSRAQELNAQQITNQFRNFDDTGKWENTQIEMPRDRSVEYRLGRFLNRTSHINADSVHREQESITRAILAAQSQPVELPNIRTIEDEHGMKWERLQYENGTVRYIPASTQEMVDIQ